MSAHLDPELVERGRRIIASGKHAPASDHPAPITVEEFEAQWRDAPLPPEPPNGKPQRRNGHATAAEEMPRLVRLSDVQPQRIEWLWPGRIPLGKLTILDGDPGVGKSTLALAIVAHVTTGRPWPDGTACSHTGSVLLMSAEDGVADTIRPRLDAAGADPAKVHAIEGVRLDDGTLRPPLSPTSPLSS
ncbi:DNA repair protein RadA [Mycobacterium heckeshornense]|uniref:AAA family ATPase n=1 Tax=Mycobacterium heckeshornense TaxID=110505 RepID=UPI001AF5ADE0|nr:AAA family ATPase [Mycobacterium heckeshornense]BCQ08246.1 DNA repair protein RadA [Mycobacterium heckeshornense]